MSEGRRSDVGAPLGEGMISRRVIVESRDVVFLKGLLEAHEGLAQVYAEKGGDLTICTTRDQAKELDALLQKLATEMNLLVR
jgi:hypothetical protein